MHRLLRAIRPVPLSLAFLATGCGAGGGPPEARTIDRLAERARPVACAPVEGVAESGAVVEDLHAVSDSTFVALLPLERRVVLYGADLRRLRVIPFEAVGPRGVKTPRSATIVDDTLVYLADAGPRRIRILSLAGEDRGTIRLPFPPDKVRSSREGVLVTALPLGIGRGESLVRILDGEESRPLALPIEPHADPRVQALANLVAVTPLPGGTVVAAHQIVSSRAALLSPRDGGGFDVRLTTTPVAASEKERLGRVPADLFERETIEGVAAPVLGAAADATTGEYLYLTRVEAPGGAGGRALVRARPDLSFVAAYRLDLDAQSVVYLSRNRTAILVDGEARWHRCVVP